MLKFVHIDADTGSEEYHRWPFVYFHGQAEFLHRSTFDDGGSAPDLCKASEPIDKYLPESDLRQDTMKSIPCEVGGQPAVAVLNHIVGPYGAYACYGRIALVSDTVALRHAMNPSDWR